MCRGSSTELLPDTFAIPRILFAIPCPDIFAIPCAPFFSFYAHLLAYSPRGCSLLVRFRAHFFFSWWGILVFVVLLFLHCTETYLKHYCCNCKSYVPETGTLSYLWRMGCSPFSTTLYRNVHVSLNSSNLSPKWDCNFGKGVSYKSLIKLTPPLYGTKLCTRALISCCPVALAQHFGLEFRFCATGAGRRVAHKTFFSCRATFFAAGEKMFLRVFFDVGEQKKKNGLVCSFAAVSRRKTFQGV